MDGLKLDKWRKNFNREIPRIQIEFDNFFTGKKLNEFFDLKLDDLSESLCLEITDDSLPNEIKERLTKLFMDTMPEDSV